MSKKVIIAVGFNRFAALCPHAGQYLKSFDFDAHDGQGDGEFTSDRAQAMEFADLAAALEFWRTTSVVRPRRPDGEPNRPLTCLTITFGD